MREKLPVLRIISLDHTIKNFYKNDRYWNNMIECLKLCWYKKESIDLINRHFFSNLIDSQYFTNELFLTCPSTTDIKLEPDRLIVYSGNDELTFMYHDIFLIELLGKRHADKYLKYVVKKVQGIIAGERDISDIIINIGERAKLIRKHKITEKELDEENATFTTK